MNLINESIIFFRQQIKDQKHKHNSDKNKTKNDHKEEETETFECL